MEPVDPRLINNVQRCEELRARDLSILPITVGAEPLVTPCLRARLSGVTRVARAHDAATPPNAFTTVRQWKNEFK